MLFFVKHGEQTTNSNAYWAVHTGTLDQVDGIPKPDVHRFVGDTLDGGFSDFLPSVHDKHIPRYAGFKESSDLLPLHWESLKSSQVSSSRAERLKCHCKCGGVEFWIARPPERQTTSLSAWILSV